MADEPKPGGFATFVAVAKDLFSLLRDAALFAGLIMLLLFPKTLNKALDAAGITEVNSSVFTWKDKLQATTQQLQVASDTISTLKANQDNLVKTAQADAAPAQQPAIQAAVASLKTADAAAGQVQQSLQTTIQNNAPLISQTPMPSSGATPPDRGFCYQEMDPRKPEGQRYSVHCETTKALCETLRGPNANTTQSICASVDLKSASWTPQHPGFLGSWYQTSATPLPSPFPPVSQH